MKKLMGILSVACLCGWLVGCAAEEATDVSDPIVTPTETPMPGDPGMTTEDPTPAVEDPAPITEDPAVSEEPTIPGDTTTEEPTTEDPAAESTEDPAAETTEEPAAP